MGNGGGAHRLHRDLRLKVVSWFLQLCGGHGSGCEDGVHSLHQLFDSPNTEVTLFVDASNAFNSINRQVLLQNICAKLSLFFSVHQIWYADDAAAVGKLQTLCVTGRTV